MTSGTFEIKEDIKKLSDWGGPVVVEIYNTYLSKPCEIFILTTIGDLGY